MSIHVSIKMTSIFADMNGYIKLVSLYTVRICSKYRHYRAKTVCSVYSSNLGHKEKITTMCV